MDIVFDRGMNVFDRGMNPALSSNRRDKVSNLNPDLSSDGRGRFQTCPLEFQRSHLAANRVTRKGFK